MVPRTPAPVGHTSQLDLNRLMTPAVGKTPGSVLQRSRMHNALADKSKISKPPAFGNAAKRSVSASLLATPTPANH
jgi:structural maintenance of chromosome 4